MNEDQDDEISERDTMGGTMCAAPQVASERAILEAAGPVGSLCCDALVSLSVKWRRIAAAERDSCRLHERGGNRNRADRHYQRSLDFDICAAALERLLANKADMPTCSK